MTISIPDSFCFCPPPPGTPDPKTPPGPNRARVDLPAQIGFTCTDYALEILRDEHRIGNVEWLQKLPEKRTESHFDKIRTCRDLLPPEENQENLPLLYHFCNLRAKSKISLGLYKILASELPRPQKARRGYTELFHLMCSAFGAKDCDWSPMNPIEMLVAKLNEHGPLLIAGKIGTDYFGPASPEGHEIKGRAILGWKSIPYRSIRDISIFWWHALVLVGADTNKDCVYFLDPKDGSKASDLKSQKVYRISYEDLRKFACDFDGYTYERNIQTQRELTGTPVYARYMPKPDELWKRVDALKAKLNHV